jgi:type 1 fimbria pilin
MRVKVWWLFGCLAGILTPLMGLAANVNVSAIVNRSPCVVNNNNGISIQFGEILTSRIDGETYFKPFSFLVNCPGATPNTIMNVRVEGTAWSFDQTALETNNPQIGIRLREFNAQGTVLSVNTTRLRFFYYNPPKIGVVPLKKEGAVLAGGTLTAAATLIVDYD